MANAAPTKRWPIGVAAEAFVLIVASFVSIFAVLFLAVLPLVGILFFGDDPKEAIEAWRLTRDFGPFFITAVVVAGAAAAATLIALSQPQWFTARYRDPPSIRWGVVAVSAALFVAGPLSIAWLISQTFLLGLHGDLGDFLTSYGPAVNAGASRITPAINAFIEGIDPQSALQQNWAHSSIGFLCFLAEAILLLEFSPNALRRISLLSLWWVWLFVIVFLVLDATRTPAGLSLAFFFLLWLLSLARRILSLFWPEPTIPPGRAILGSVTMGAPFVAAAAILLASGAFSAWR